MDYYSLLVRDMWFLSEDTKFGEDVTTFHVYDLFQEIKGGLDDLHKY